MPFADLRFLVVEDHEFQRRSLVSLLSRLGVRFHRSAQIDWPENVRLR